MPRAERELLFAVYSKLSLLICSCNQEVLAFFEHLGYSILPWLTFSKVLIHEHQDKQ